MEKVQRYHYCIRYKKYVPINCSLCVFEKKCKREKHLL